MKSVDERPWEHVDPLLVAELRELIGDRLAPLLRGFLVIAFNLISRMAEAADSRRMGDLAECAHELAHGSRAVGALGLARLGERAAVVAGQRCNEELPRLLLMLQCEYGHVAVLFEEEIRLAEEERAVPRERVA